MIGHNWKVEMWQRPDCGVVDILFYEDRSNDEVLVHRLAIEEGHNVWKSAVHKTYMPVDVPSLRIPYAVLGELQKAISSQGIRAPGEHKVEGLYEAQSRHLADLRHLLKLDK